MKKEIIKFIENRYSFPYLYYDKEEQTWYNEFFLYDIKSGTIFVSDVVKDELGKKFGRVFIDKILFEVVSKWFKIAHDYPVNDVV